MSRDEFGLTIPASIPFKTLFMSASLVIHHGTACGAEPFRKVLISASHNLHVETWEITSNKVTDKTLPLDLDKRIFLGDAGDEKQRSSAALVAHHISGQAFGLPEATSFRSA